MFNSNKIFGNWADWRYLTNTELESKEELIGWTKIDYDHSKFKVGLIGIGYGDRGVLTEVPKGTTAVLMRHAFELEEKFKSDSLYLIIDYDDGFAAYLNGEKIASANVPEGRLDQFSIATTSHESGELEQFDISKHNANPQDVQDKLLYENDIFVRAGNYVSARFGENFIRVSFSIPTPEVEKFVDVFPKVMDELS